MKTLFKLPPALFHGLLVDFAYDFWCRLLDEWGELTGLGLIGDLHNCANAGRGASVRPHPIGSRATVRPETRCPLEYAEQPAFVATIWKGRFANLASRVKRLAREIQGVELADRMGRGDLTHGQAERLHLFLDLERLGLAQRWYPKSIYAARRREAAKLGYSGSDYGADALDVNLADLLAAYLQAVDEH